jgi:hypothetical protein
MLGEDPIIIPKEEGDKIAQQNIDAIRAAQLQQDRGFSFLHAPQNVKGASDTRLENLYEAGINPQLALFDDNYDVNQQLYDRQSWGEALGTAVGGGIVKGALTLGETVGYLGAVWDYDNLVGATSDLDEGVTNALSDTMTEWKKEFDEANPIYSQGTGDAGWWMQGIQSTIDSAVGFGVPGGAIAKGIGLAVKALANPIVRETVKNVGTSLLLNRVESQMMGKELYNNTMQKALAEGLDYSEASRIAQEKQQEFMVRNYSNTLFNAVGLSKALRNSYMLKGGAEKALKYGWVKEQTLNAFSESLEEGASGFLQTESERDADLELGMRKSDGSSMLGRVGDYVSSAQGITEMTFGAMGGPFQHGLTRAIGGMNEAYNKKVGNTSFTEEAPTQSSATVAKPKSTVTNPGDLKEYLQKKHPGLEDAKLEQVISGQLNDEALEKSKAEWEKKNTQWEDHKTKNKDYYEEQEKLAKEKEEYSLWEKRKTDFEKKQRSKEQMDKTGTIAQTTEEISTFLKNDVKLEQEYQQALKEGDDIKAKDIENQRFETMFLRHAQKESVFRDGAKPDGSLQSALEEHIAKGKEANATVEDKAAAVKAQTFLDKLPAYRDMYKKIRKNNPGLEDYAFRLLARKESVDSVIEQLNAEVEKAKVDIAKSVANTMGVTVSPLETKIIELNQELVALKEMKEDALRKGNMEALSLFDKRVEKVEALKKQTEELREQDSNKLSAADIQEVNKRVAEQKDYLDKVKARTDALVAYDAISSAYSRVVDGSLAKTVEKERVEHIKESIEQMSTGSEVLKVQRLLDNLKVNTSSKVKLEKQFKAKKETLTKAKEVAEKAYEQKQQQVEAFKKKKQSLADDKKLRVKRIKTLEKALKNYQDKPGYEEAVSYALMELQELQEQAPDYKAEQLLIEAGILELEAELENLNSKYTFDFKAALEKAAKKEHLSPSEADGVANATGNTAGNTMAAGVRSQTDSQNNQKAERGTVIHGTAKGGLTESEVPTAPTRSVAYVSHSGDKGNKTLNEDEVIGDWLETTKDLNKEGTVLEMQPITSSKPYHTDEEVAAITLFKKVSKRKVKNPLTEEEVKVLRHLPMTFVFKKDGEVIMHNGHPVVGNVPRGKTHSDLVERGMMVQKHLNEGVYTTTVTKVHQGIFKVEEDETSQAFSGHIKDVFGDVTLAISDGQNLYTNFSSNGHTKAEINASKSTPGFTYAIVRTANGTLYPMRLNLRKLDMIESKALATAVAHIASGTAPNAEIKDVPGFAGLSYLQLINLLVYEGSNTVTSSSHFHIDLVNKVLKINDNEIPFTDVKKNLSAIEDYVSNMYRTVRSDGLNTTFEKMNLGISDSFTWKGKEVKYNANYNEFLYGDVVQNEHGVKTGVLSTNAIKQPNGAVFIQPYVEYKSPDLIKPPKKEVATPKTEAAPVREESSDVNQEQIISSKIKGYQDTVTNSSDPIIIAEALRDMLTYFESLDSQALDTIIVDTVSLPDIEIPTLKDYIEFLSSRGAKLSSLNVTAEEYNISEGTPHETLTGMQIISRGVHRGGKLIIKGEAINYPNAVKEVKSVEEIVETTSQETSQEFVGPFTNPLIREFVNETLTTGYPGALQSKAFENLSEEDKDIVMQKLSDPLAEPFENITKPKEVEKVVENTVEEEVEEFEIPASENSVGLPTSQTEEDNAAMCGKGVTKKPTVKRGVKKL